LFCFVIASVLGFSLLKVFSLLYNKADGDRFNRKRELRQSRTQEQLLFAMCTFLKSTLSHKDFY